MNKNNVDFITYIQQVFLYFSQKKFMHQVCGLNSANVDLKLNLNLSTLGYLEQHAATMVIYKVMGPDQKFLSRVGSG